MMDLLWQPNAQQAKSTNLFRFQQYTGQDHLWPDYRALHHWSINDKEAFWKAVWDFCGITGDIKPGSEPLTRADIYQHDADFRHAKWFPSARLNFAENLLRHAHKDSHTNKAAVIAIREDGKREEVSYQQLYQQAGAFAANLLAIGIKPGDRVAAYMPNCIETLVAALGSAWVGATWSSCSPDFGEQGVLDRFGQISPSVVVTTDAYQYNGKTIQLTDRIEKIQSALNPKQLVLVPSSISNAATLPESFQCTQWEQWTSLPESHSIPDFARFPFDHPLYILYSSGTTGKPKCIVHGAGGTLLQHTKEHQLHLDLQNDDIFFYFTTCGWMMWNWLVSGLQGGATLVLYDGNPAFPDASRLFNLIDQESISIFGTSAKFISAIEKAGLKPRQSHRLDSLKTLLSTGSPLLHDSYDFIYEQISSNLLVSSISGGTDIVSCFALGNPALPVIRGELQCLGLGMDVQVWDTDGQAVTGTQGELVCATPFPSRPVYFWNDADGSRFNDAYFNRFQHLTHMPCSNVWAHGDFAEIRSHENHDGLIIHGRSDAVLNPGGVRIGTAEIYRQVETLPEIRESIVIGQQWQGDVRVVLFVVLQPGTQLNENLSKRIRQSIRSGASPRHVPAKILEVTEIPRTVSGKIVELAVREVVHGRQPGNISALANPDSLQQFAKRKELEPE